MLIILKVIEPDEQDKEDLKDAKNANRRVFLNPNVLNGDALNLQIPCRIINVLNIKI